MFLKDLTNPILFQLISAVSQASAVLNYQAYRHFIRSSELHDLISGLYTGPYFSLYTAGNVSVLEGDTAHLPCRVHQVTIGAFKTFPFNFVSDKESYSCLDQKQGLSNIIS